MRQEVDTAKARDLPDGSVVASTDTAYVKVRVNRGEPWFVTGCDWRAPDEYVDEKLRSGEVVVLRTGDGGEG
jgi:hypothetical protein